jgi:hypothetical protein
MHTQNKPTKNRRSGILKMAVGALMFLFLGLIAVASMLNAVENGGVYFIWWGPMVVGAYLFYKGLRQFVRGDSQPRKIISPTPAQPSSLKQPIAVAIPANVLPVNLAIKPQKYCSSCGSLLSSNAKFCNKCGKSSLSKQ